MPGDEATPMQSGVISSIKIFISELTNFYVEISTFVVIINEHTILQFTVDLAI